MNWLVRWRVYWEERESPSQVVEARVPVWPAALLAGLWCAVWVRGRGRASERRRRGECEGCGFPLTLAGVGAECGRH